MPPVDSSQVVRGAWGGAGVSGPRIVLVRHGRSAHAVAGWLDRAAFLRWREAYEAAGLAAHEAPPPLLCELAAAAGAVATSDTPRAVESARLLAPAAPLVASPLLRELELAPPHLPFRLPLAGWAFAFAPRMLSGALATPAEQERAREAARWLVTLAAGGTVVAVTHHSFRAVVAATLQSEGWRAGVPRRRSAHWSAWTFVRQA